MCLLFVQVIGSIFSEKSISTVKKDIQSAFHLFLELNRVLVRYPYNRLFTRSTSKIILSEPLSERLLYNYPLKLSKDLRLEKVCLNRKTKSLWILIVSRWMIKFHNIEASSTMEEEGVYSMHCFKAWQHRTVFNIYWSQTWTWVIDRRISTTLLHCISSVDVLSNNSQWDLVES